MSKWLCLLLATSAVAATRPHYGGVLRVEVREAVETADPPPNGPAGFAISEWDAGHKAVYTADDNAPGGRPYLDRVEILMGRPLRDQSYDLELGKADIVQLGPNELRRASPGRKTWSSSPNRLIALVFAARVTDPRVREALALAVDRVAIHNVLLQRQGEVSGALLPQWLSGYAFLFPALSDPRRAQELMASVPPSARVLTLSAENRDVAARIALNARDAGLAITVTPAGQPADIRLVELRIPSADPAKALAGITAALGLRESVRADSPEALYAAERSLLEGYAVIPLFHVPDVFGVGPRVKGGPGIGPLGEWRFENLWLEGGRP